MTRTFCQPPLYCTREWERGLVGHWVGLLWVRLKLSPYEHIEMFKCCYSNYEENSHSLAFTKASVFCCESMELSLWVYFEYYYTQTFTTRRNSTMPDSLITGLHWENGTFPHSQLDKSSLSQGFQKIAYEKHLFLDLTKVIYKSAKHKQFVIQEIM